MTAAALVAVLLDLATTQSPRFRARAEVVAPVILAEATRAGLDPVLVAAVAVAESTLRMDAVGARGEVGVMQLHPRGIGRKLCRDLDVTTLAGNVACGVRALVEARDRCGGEPSRWLGAYAGWPCGESRYARRVLRMIANTNRERKT